MLSKRVHKKEKEKEKVVLRQKTLYAHTCVYNVFGNKLDDRPIDILYLIDEQAKSFSGVS